MRPQLEKRLEELKKEYEEGQVMLADLEARKANLQATLLRISGAMQVLEELLAAGVSAAVGRGEAAGGENAGSSQT